MNACVIEKGTAVDPVDDRAVQVLAGTPLLGVQDVTREQCREASHGALCPADATQPIEPLSPAAFRTAWELLARHRDPRRRGRADDPVGEQVRDRAATAGRSVRLKWGTSCMGYEIAAGFMQPGEILTARPRELAEGLGATVHRATARRSSRSSGRVA